MSKASNKRVYWAIASAALLTFIGILNETFMNVVYPQLVKQFGVPLSTVQWITTGYLLTVTIIMGTTAYLLRQFPVRWLHLAAALAFIAGNLMGATAESFGVLLAGRVIQGIATGLSTPIMFQLIFADIPREKLGFMTGIAAMVISFAPALGPTYGGLVAASVSWREIYWFLLPLACLALIGGQLFIRNQPFGNSAPFSSGALVLLALALSALIYAISLIGKGGFSVSFFLMAALGILLFLAFIYVNNHGKTQLVNLEIFQIKSIWLAALTYFGLQFVNIGLSVAVPVYAQYVLGSSSLIAGLILLPGSIVGAILAPISGTLADHFGYKKPLVFGASLFVAGLILLTLIQPLLPPLLFVLVHILIRAGFNLTFSNTISNATTLVTRKQSADVNSAFNMVQQFAGSLGVGLATALIAIFQKTGSGSLAVRTFQGGRLDFIVFLLTGILVLLMIIGNFKLQEEK